MFGSDVSGTNDPPEPCEIDAPISLSVVGQIVSVVGSAFVQRAGCRIEAVGIGEPVLPGDVIETSANSTLTLLFKNGTVFELSPLTRVVLTDEESGADAEQAPALLSVARGGFAFSNHNARGPRRLSIDTPFGNVRGDARRAGIGLVTFAALTFAVIEKLQAETRDLTISDDDILPWQDVKHGVFEIVNKEVIPRVISIADPTQSVLVRPIGSGFTVDFLSNTSNQMAERLAAAQNAFSTFLQGQQDPFITQQQRADLQNAHPTAGGSQGSSTLFTETIHFSPVQTASLTSTSVSALPAAGGLDAGRTLDVLNITQFLPPLAKPIISANLPSNGLTNNTAPILIISAPPGGSVEVFKDGISLGFATETSTPGIFNFVPTLGDGTFTFTATASTSTTNNTVISSPFVVTVDATAPSAPIITVAANDVASTHTTVANGGLTNDATPTLSGTAEAGSTVTIFDGVNRLGSTTADGGGAWTYTPPVLADGAHHFTATATDAAGNVGPGSANFAVAIDATAPLAPTITAVSDDVALGTGPVANGGPTNDATPTLSGTAEAGSTVAVFDGAKSLGTATTDTNGNWVFTTPGLSEGGHSFTTTATDVAGNVSAISSAYSIAVDVTAPSIAISANLEGDDRVNAAEDNTFTVTGTTTGVENGQLVHVTVSDGVGGHSVNTTATVSGGVWSAADVDISGFANGNISVTADVSDQAGNAATQASHSVILDNAAPSTASVTMSDSDLQTGETSTLTITFSEAVTGFDNSDVTVQNGTLTTLTSANGGITWTGTFTPTANIQDPTNVVTVASSFADLVGNAGTGGSSANYSVNTLTGDPNDHDAEVQPFSNPNGTVQGSNVFGTPGPDNLTAGNSGQTMYGGAGNDIITGNNSGSPGDIIFGGSGNDTIAGFDAAKKEVILSLIHS
jgi:hypothetical protein